jgi:aspartyl-tRNA(Asn)/glutamyl-tRNA(Gln) amidotransferase subunit A
LLEPWEQQGIFNVDRPSSLALIGRPFDEETLFSLGTVIEQAAGLFALERWW